MPGIELRSSGVGHRQGKLPTHCATSPALPSFLSGLFSELRMAVPWGHIAAKAWGPKQNPPVLCLHGWLDNANSFDRLIPLLPKDFYYVAMDFGGHGLSSHYNPGHPYYHQNFVGEVRRIMKALKWERITLIGHSFGGVVGGMFSSIFPELVDKLVLLDSIPFALDCSEMENLLTYKRKALERTLELEAAPKPSHVLSPNDMLQGFLKNRELGQEDGQLLLQRGTTQVPEGVVLNRDRRIAQPELSFDFVSKEFFVHAMRRMQAQVLLVKASQGFSDVRRENNENQEPLNFVLEVMRSTLKERFQYVEVSGNHYIHMNEPQHVAEAVTAFLQGRG
ncbi:serine hydrolase-like protein 2 [Suncus etruscus]|uniref:serine hydrolase-like protein 2 n=1 Tax=Suncus etruscus TaxID=109475 RepID=UPI00210F977E|nr:serine hydrolase-like protein 2 [Suncus etruscus]